MLPYWFLFLIPVCFATTPARRGGGAQPWTPTWRLMFVLLVLMIGLRHEVGGDWINYVAAIDLAADGDFFDAISKSDPAYGLLNWLTVQLGGGSYFVNTVCAIMFAWGLVTFSLAQPRPWLALVVAIPYLVTVVAMGYTRQGVAIGFAMLALAALSEQRIIRFVGFVVLAATFHKSAVILMPLAVLAASRKRLWTIAWVGVSSAFFYALLLQDSVDYLTVNYIDAELESTGAAIRVAMNALPAVLFLVFRRRFEMPIADKRFWTWMAVIALTFVGLLAISPSSTAVDRMALYWIPIQLFVLSRPPNALGVPNGRNDFWVCVVVVYSAAVMFVWLVFATHAYAWLPYQFYPWVVLWN